MLRLLGALLALALPAVTLAGAVVHSLQGVARSGAADLRQGERVLPGALITTGPQSRLALRFDDGTDLLLGESSQLRLMEFRYARDGSDRLTVALSAGAARVMTGEIVRQRPSRFSLRAPQANLGVLGESEFSVVLAEGAFVSVSRGTVIAANREATVSLVPGPPARIASTATLPEPAAALPERVALALRALGAPAPLASPRAQIPPPKVPAQTPAPPVPQRAQTPPPKVPAQASAPEGARLVTQRFLFAGASLGRSIIDEGLTRGLITSGSVEENGTGFKLFVGYQFHPNFGAEVAFVDLGHASYEGLFQSTTISGGELQVSGINLAALGRLPVGERFAFFAKIGVFFWQAEAKDSAGGTPFSTKTDGSDASAGIGASYQLASKLALRAEGEVFRVGKDKASLLSLGVLFTF